MAGIEFSSSLSLNNIALVYRTRFAYPSTHQWTRARRFGATWLRATLYCEGGLLMARR